MQLQKFISELEMEFPEKTAWENDRIGLQVDTGKENIENIHVTLELNDDVIDEAVGNNSDIIISFHPLIFRPIKEINQNDRVTRLVSKLIKNDISLYIIHTNFDAHPYGTSYELCSRLGFQRDQYIEKDEEYPERGMGAIVEFKDEKSLEDIVQKVSDICSTPVRFNEGASNKINKLAILGGSGSSYIDKAIDKGADALITADITYHEFHRVNGVISIIDPGHYEMEQFVIEALEKNISKRFKDDLNIFKSKIRTNPVYYYPENNYKENQIKYLNK